ncbi:hypothetical protein [Thermogymnomonas acidicola]|uniref:TrmB family transcriptional regulator sugar-binding domain-containing protein n=1 Tax=Thermogymnomonas acidicola TaxID=399579 RepID=UPI00094621F0|nr:TrmB family transcriptional regulator sugar-binding domain-containing protein [Thermogymnomonas acidicola]
MINNAIQVVLDARHSVYVESTPDILDEIAPVLGLAMSRGGVRVTVLLFSHTPLLELQQKVRSQFRDLRTVHPGQFFTVIGDDRQSVFMPRSVALGRDGSRYGYVFRDRDMSWFLVHNYFNAWYRATRINVSSGPAGKVYYSHRLAINDIMEYGLNGRSAVLTGGVMRESGKSVTMEGRILSFTVSEDIVNFTFSSGGDEKYTVGGYDSQVEDIEMVALEVL